MQVNHEGASLHEINLFNMAALLWVVVLAFLDPILAVKYKDREQVWGKHLGQHPR